MTDNPYERAKSGEIGATAPTVAVPGEFDGDSFDVYGKVKEGVHIAGYSFERACGHLEWLLDEERWKLGGRFDNVNDFLDSVKLDQFRIVTDQRKRIAARIKELQPEASNRTIAGVIGVSHTTIDRDLNLGTNVPPDKPKPPETKAPETPPSTNVPPPASELSGAEAANKLAEKEAKVRGTLGTRNNEWYTPAPIIEMARKVMGGIDLDPASSKIANRVVGAGEYFTREEDGLGREWHGNVWMNPPYSPPEMGHFVSKMVEEYMAGNVRQAVVLANAYCDTAWFHELAPVASAMCFTKGRIRFVSPEGVPVDSPIQGSVFFYLGDDAERFGAMFRDVGFVAVQQHCQRGG